MSNLRSTISRAGAGEREWREQRVFIPSEWNMAATAPRERNGIEATALMVALNGLESTTRFLNPGWLRRDLHQSIIPEVSFYMNIIAQWQNIHSTIALPVAQRIQDVASVSLSATIEEEKEPQSLAQSLLNVDPSTTTDEVRRLILIAEDASFLVEDQRSSLSMWLLSFALQNRNSEDSRDRLVVWSAIRTCASLLARENLDSLLPLLSPGSRIDTTLVSAKMIGRIFEAKPPGASEQFSEIGIALTKMCTSLLNPYAIENANIAAKAQLSFTALVALGDQEARSVAKTISELHLKWFSKQVAQEINRLVRSWSQRHKPVIATHKDLIQDVSEILQPKVHSGKP